MLEMLMQWYRRRFSDPEAIALLVILVAGFGIIFFFSGLLAPLLVAIVLAYLLEWPTVRLQSIGCSRRWATSVLYWGGGFRRYIATDGVRGTAYRLATGHLLNPRYAGDAQ